MRLKQNHSDDLGDLSLNLPCKGFAMNRLSAPAIPIAGFKFSDPAADPAADPADSDDVVAGDAGFRQFENTL